MSPARLDDEERSSSKIPDRIVPAGTRLASVPFQKSGLNAGTMPNGLEPDETGACGGGAAGWLICQGSRAQAACAICKTSSIAGRNLRSWLNRRIRALVSLESI